jgi:hypothetical protein
MNNYEQQAIDFLEKTNTTFKAEFVRNGKYFDDDVDNRDIYNITLTRGNRVYTFEFGQSIINSGFYAIYGKTKYQIPCDKLDKTKAEIRRYVKQFYNWNFGTSHKDVIHYPKSPTAYDVIACLTKYDVGSFEDFCSEYGYDTDSRKAEKTYNAVCEEWLHVQKLWNDDELEELGEIQ